MHATLSYSTEVFAGQPVEAAIRWARTLGLEAIEVGRLHAEQLHADASARGPAKELAAELGVRLASLHAWTQTDGLAEVCPAACDLGVGLIVVHCPPEALAADFDGCSRTLARWADWCDGHGITLTVENSSRQPLEPFVRLFQGVPGLKFTLDVKHAYKPAVLGLTHVDYIRALGDRLANFHLLGIDPARDDLLGDGIPAGHDAIDYAVLAADLAARGYAGLLTVESSNPGLPAEQLDAAYFDLAPADADSPTLAHRLSRHNVRFFAENFARVIRPPQGL